MKRLLAAKTLSFSYFQITRIGEEWQTARIGGAESIRFSGRGKSGALPAFILFPVCCKVPARGSCYHTARDFVTPNTS